MRKPIALVVAVAAALVTMLSMSPTTTYATSYTGGTTMNEMQALSTCNPNPAPSGSGGSGGFTYDSVTNELTWDVTFSNLSGAAIAAHFHGPANPGMDAGIQVTITDLTSPSQGMATISEAQEADLLAGLYYVNYHTSACPGGEIRGQVNIAPKGSVGGVVELPVADGNAVAQPAGSGSHTGLIVGLSALGAVVVVAGGGAAWYARRRRAL
jgi:hypothetical protein